MAAREQFSHDEVVKRTARRLGKKPEVIAHMLAVYANEYVEHARETDPALIMPAIKPEPAKKAAPKAASRPAKKATTPRKAPAKATSPAGGQETAQGDSAGTGSALMDAQIRREAESSVALDRDETHVVG